MRRQHYMGRDEKGEPVWSETTSAPATVRVEQQHMSQNQAVLHGYKQLEEKGWKSAYSKRDILRTWKED